MTINKEKYPDVFVENSNLQARDKALFDKAAQSDMSENEKYFFQKMKEKESGEFAPSADILIDEHDNSDEIYFIRYYYDEYRVGRGLPGKRASRAIYMDSLAATLNSDLFPILGRRIKFIEWLRENDFQGINYLGNSVFNLGNSNKNG